MILRELAQVITHEAILAAVVDLFEVVRVSNYWSAQHVSWSKPNDFLAVAVDFSSSTAALDCSS